VHAHNIPNYTSTANPFYTHIYRYAYLYMHIHLYAYVHAHVCACLDKHAYTCVTNVQRQAGEQGVSILIQMKILWKTIEFQHKCALKIIYFLSETYSFLLLFY